MSNLQNRNYFMSGRVMQLPVGAILESSGRRLHDDGLQELTQSVLRYGILQPLMVRRQPNGYALVAGSRRLRAAKLAGLGEVPCILLSLDELQSDTVALLENLQRRDLDYLEEAEALARLMRCSGLSQEQLAQQLGKSQSAIANKLRLLRHTPPVRQALRAQKLSERHARALLRLPSESARLAAIAVIAQQGMNVAAAEAYIDSIAIKRPVRQEERDLTQFFSTLAHGLCAMQTAGIRAASSRQENEQEIILTIRIPKNAS